MNEYAQRFEFSYFTSDDTELSVYTSTLTTRQYNEDDARHSLETQAIALARKFSEVYNEDVFYNEQSNVYQF